MTTRIAMWSGPRNISTAMMRSWENRPDCNVVDEPFYACYLYETGLTHPCREAILETMSHSREAVIKQLQNSDPGCELQYQKHMTHHMPKGTDLTWSKDFQHCFLIREPASVIASYLNKMPSVESDDIGIERQLELFTQLTEITGRMPLVIDSNDVLKNPQLLLAKLCDKIGIPRFADHMFAWPPGRRPSDGVWASHWYQSVEQSTGFAPFQQREISLEGEHDALAKRLDHCYRQLAEHAFS
ncbi:MAG: hypothetical protein ACI9GW_002396 [Halieaceae bacterium]|jgi:hypothetical protein